MRNLIGAALALIAGPAAFAQPIAVVNSSFEDPVVLPAGYTIGGVPGWTVASGGGDWGVFYPTVSSWGYVTSLGHQLLYTNGPTLQQTLTATVQPNTTYTLLVDVINRPTYNGNNYVVELYAGATLLARDSNSLSPPPGSSLTSVLSYHVGASAPFLGEPLRIRLGGVNQTNFDNVRVVTDYCYANCDLSTAPPILNVNDFTCFLSRFAAASPYANCDGSTAPPVLNVNDFTCFLSRFAAGCP